MAVDILKALIKKGEADNIRKTFSSMIPKWQKKVVKGLQGIDEKEVLSIFK